MLYEVIAMNDAKKELKDIDNYISYILYEPIIAKKLIRKIQDGFLDLSYMPMKYKLLIKKRNFEIRKSIVKNYIIIYQIEIKIKIVYILHIFYSKRNYLKSFN